MARFINNEKEIISRNIDNMSLTSSIEYSKYLKGVPTFVTYYSRNILTSTEDTNLKNVKSIVGSESPIRYDIIEDFPIYGIDGLSPTPNFDDFGLDYEVESQAVILPDTIRPNVDDYMTIPYNGNDMLFRITALEIDKVNGKKFFKITFNLSKDDITLITEQLGDEYVSHYENIGKGKRYVIAKKDSITIEHIIKTVDNLVDFYIREYLDKDYNIIYYKHHNELLYNEYLTRFLLNTKCLYKISKKLLKSINLQDIMIDKGSIYYVYPMTIYYAIENRDINKLKLEDIKSSQIIPDRNSPFYFMQNKYFRCQYNTTEVNIHPHKGKFIYNIQNDEKYNEDMFVIEDIIISYLNNQIDINDEFLDYIDKIIFEPFLNTYLLLPCLIYILQEEKDRLENKKPELIYKQKETKTSSYSKY